MKTVRLAQMALAVLSCVFPLVNCSRSETMVPEGGNGSAVPAEAKTETAAFGSPPSHQVWKPGPGEDGHVYALTDSTQNPAAETLDSSQSRHPVTDILFIGNSFTGFGRVWEALEKALNEQHDMSVTTAACLLGGANMKEHYDKTKDPPMERIRTGNYDIVVIQGGAALYLEDRQQIFREYMPRFIRAVREAGATPVLFCPWSAGRLNVEDIQLHVDFYTEAAERWDTGLAPVGEAWRRVMEERPDLGLYVDAVGHPSQVGVYLNACILYGVLSGRSPEGVRFDVPTIPIAEQFRKRLAAGKKTEIDPETATYLQRIAAETVARHEDRNRNVLRTP